MASACPAQRLHGIMRTPLASLLFGDASEPVMVVLAQQGPRICNGAIAYAHLAGFAGMFSLCEAPSRRGNGTAILQGSGATGYFVEYAGEVFENMSMEGRMTVCNMSIEMGARGGMIAPDDDHTQLSERP